MHTALARVTTTARQLAIRPHEIMKISQATASLIQKANKNGPDYHFGPCADALNVDDCGWDQGYPDEPRRVHGSSSGPAHL